MTLREACQVALSLPEAIEADHHGIPSFRVRGKIFATVPDGEHIRVMLGPEESRAAARADRACEELYWGAKLSGVTVTLAKVRRERLAALLLDAWLRKAPRSLAKQMMAE
jgi:hypothetical protein